MQIGLLAAGIGSIYPLKQLGTGILLILLTLFNAVMNLWHEDQAAASVAALQKMTVIKARVRRDGQLAEIPVMKTVTLDVVQWLICAAVALSIVVAAEIRKAVLRWRTAATAVQSAGARPTGATTTTL